MWELDILSFVIGIVFIPVLSLIYIGIVVVIEGKEEWNKSQQESELSLEDGQTHPQTPSEMYWSKLTDLDNQNE